MPWLTKKGGMRYGSASKKIFESWVRDGLIVSKLHNGQIRVHTDAIDEYLKRYQIGGTPENIQEAADRVFERL